VIIFSQGDKYFHPAQKTHILFMPFNSLWKEYVFEKFTSFNETTISKSSVIETISDVLVWDETSWLKRWMRISSDGLELNIRHRSNYGLESVISKDQECERKQVWANEIYRGWKIILFRYVTIYCKKNYGCSKTCMENLLLVTKR